jgi:hypothetical protein
MFRLKVSLEKAAALEFTGLIYKMGRWSFRLDSSFFVDLPHPTWYCLANQSFNDDKTSGWFSAT